MIRMITVLAIGAVGLAVLVDRISTGSATQQGVVVETLTPTVTPTEGAVEPVLAYEHQSSYDALDNLLSVYQKELTAHSVTDETTTDVLICAREMADAFSHDRISQVRTMDPEEVIPRLTRVRDLFVGINLDPANRDRLTRIDFVIEGYERPSY